MGDYQSEFERKVGRISEPEPVQRQKGFDEEKETPPTPKNKEASALSLYSLLTSVFKKLFAVFSEKKPLSQEYIATSEQLTQAAKTFKTLLTELSQKDFSRNVSFSERLSAAWGELSHCVEITQRIHIRTPIDVDTLIGLITAIKTYPQGATHTLGYYLTAHAGEEWLPFPYMEMLTTLHKEYAHRAKQSELRSWIEAIDKALQ